MKNGTTIRTTTFALLLGVVLAMPARAQEAPRPIQDNSFLVEEAYNQEKGVVQHISAFMRTRDGNWAYTFTQEWPVFGQRNQFSYTLPLSRVQGATGPATGVGDLALNWRYQLVGSGETRTAFAPRLSLLLPTGNASRGLGSGGAGVQVNLPLSVELTKSLVAHSNVGATQVPRARIDPVTHASLTNVNVGQSVIWLLTPKLNLMLEGAWSSTRAPDATGSRAWESSFLLSPGIRTAIDFPSGLQVVPGIAVPIGVGPSRGERSLFLYLSFEHPFAATK